MVCAIAQIHPVASPCWSLEVLCPESDAGRTLLEGVPISYKHSNPALNLYGGILMVMQGLGFGMRKVRLDSE
jgi:hypothetical protein